LLLVLEKDSELDTGINIKYPSPRQSTKKYKSTKAQKYKSTKVQKYKGKKVQSTGTKLYKSTKYKKTVDV
jgi:hypothetical protein